MNIIRFCCFFYIVILCISYGMFWVIEGVFFIGSCYCCIVGVWGLRNVCYCRLLGVKKEVRFGERVFVYGGFRVVCG